MIDCTNAEMRDLLPDLAAGRLSAADRERVERHVSSCPECADELLVLRSAARVLGAAPTVDVARIVAALPAAPRPVPGVVPIGSRRRDPRAGRPAWATTRRVAAIAAVAVGAVGLAIAGGERSTRSGLDSARVGAPVAVAPVAPGAPVSGIAPAAPEELSLAAGVSDLSDESLRALLGDLEQLGDSTLTEPTDLLPEMSGVDDEAGV